MPVEKVRWGLQRVPLSELITELKARSIFVYAGRMVDISRCQVPHDTGDRPHVMCILPLDA